MINKNPIRNGLVKSDCSKLKSYNKKLKERIEELEKQLLLHNVSQRSELLLSAICQFTKRNTQKEIQEVEKWIETDFRK